MAALKDRLLQEKENRIYHLEEEIKLANEKLFRNNKFKQSVFTIDDGDFNRQTNTDMYEPQRLPHAPPTDFQRQLNSSLADFQKFSMPQQDGFGTKAFNMTNQMSHSIDNMNLSRPHDLQTPKGTKENPVELKPVRVSSAHSVNSFEMGPPSPAFSKASTDQVNNEINPSNNPYYMGIYHGPNLMMGNRRTPSNMTQSHQDSSHSRKHEIVSSQNDRSW